MTILSDGDFRKLMNATMRLSAPCRKCGRPIQFEEGAWFPWGDARRRRCPLRTTHLTREC